MSDTDSEKRLPNLPGKRVIPFLDTKTTRTGDDEFTIGWSATNDFDVGVNHDAARLPFNGSMHGYFQGECDKETTVEIKTSEVSHGDGTKHTPFMPLANYCRIKVSVDEKTSIVIPDESVKIEYMVHDQDAYLPFQMRHSAGRKPVFNPVKGAANGHVLDLPVMWPVNKAHKKIKGYKITIPKKGELANGKKFRIHSIELFYKPPTMIPDITKMSEDDKAGITPAGPCPSMDFRPDSSIPGAAKDMTKTVGDLIKNTQCENIFANDFATYVDTKGDASMKADAEAEASARASASASGEVGWAGSKVEGETEVETDARIASSLETEMSAEASAGLSNDTFDSSVGCGATTIMAGLAESAQNDIQCMISTFCTSQDASVMQTVTVEFDVGGDISGKGTKVDVLVDAQVKAQISMDALTNIANTLATQAQSMIDSATDISNTSETEGLFPTATDATIAGVSSRSSTINAHKTSIVGVINSQVTAIKQDSKLTFRVGGGILDGAEVNLQVKSGIDLIAGMMVKNVLANDSFSKIETLLKEAVKSSNSASSKGLTFDFMSMLLAPLIVLVLGGGFLFLGGPSMLIRTMTGRYAMMFAAALLVGSIVGLVLSLLSGSIGGSAACGLGVALGAYLLYKAWSARAPGMGSDAPPSMAEPRLFDGTTV